MALNQAHYASLMQRLSQGNGNKAIFLEHLRIELDLANLVTALRLVRRPGLTALAQQHYNASDVRPLLMSRVDICR